MTFRPVPSVLQRQMREWRKEVKRVLAYTGRHSPPRGIVVYEGPSRLDGSDIVVIGTGFNAPPHNPKLGDAVQFYVLPLDTEPVEAVRSGADRSVCGSCVHRPSVGGDCYVATQWIPARLWRLYHDGLLLRFHQEGAAALVAGAFVRFGAWGDPAAVPLGVWEPMVHAASHHTGYTQEWPRLDARWSSWLMASVSSPEERQQAKRLGWRTFRTRLRGLPDLPGEAECPATAKGVACLACRGCGGRGVAPHRTDYVIDLHGQKYRERGQK